MYQKYLKLCMSEQHVVSNQRNSLKARNYGGK